MSTLPEVGQDILARLAKTNVPKKQGLFPLFEAIANSYDSIAEDKNGDQIIITILDCVDN